ncbi:hypothetical protein LT85_3953 [Collimonas arenae]|uniref:Uncharacterized protein n=1 Tax=Collimonas arenae TaxID=279058 RepID=A0A0A1FF12_9BURK|nr:hypothetical protein LT85_3953 [Collimonas arenae]
MAMLRMARGVFDMVSLEIEELSKCAGNNCAEYLLLIYF